MCLACSQFCRIERISSLTVLSFVEKDARLYRSILLHTVSLERKTIVE